MLYNYENLCCKMRFNDIERYFYYIVKVKKLFIDYLIVFLFV